MANYDKRKILKRILTIPANQRNSFWQREFKLFKDLLLDYPSLEFWSKVNLNLEIDSLKVLHSDFAKKILEKKYQEFNYILPEQQQTKLNDTKTGKDFKSSSKPKNLRQFLS